MLADEFIEQHWYTTTMIIRGKEIDMTQTEGSYFSKGEDIIGLIHETKGRKLQKDVLITTNDNINAIRFYQKRGFDMERLFHNALDMSRKIKPEIPLSCAICKEALSCRNSCYIQFR